MFIKGLEPKNTNLVKNLLIFILDVHLSGVFLLSLRMCVVFFGQNLFYHYERCVIISKKAIPLPILIKKRILDPFHCEEWGDVAERYHQYNHKPLSMTGIVQLFYDRILYNPKKQLSSNNCFFSYPTTAGDSSFFSSILSTLYIILGSSTSPVMKSFVMTIFSIFL